jgi:SAM-dependent methyltransferase
LELLDSLSTPKVFGIEHDGSLITSQMMAGHDSRARRSLFRRGVRFAYRLATDGDYRSVLLTRLRRPANLFQPYTDTAPDRYPLIFSFAREKLGAQSQARLLSIGCSTGEEVFTLRRYLPLAIIKGLDINPRNIEICKAQLHKSPDTGIEFKAAGSTRDEGAGSYDAIFCLAVLRHGALAASGVQRCDRFIRFEDFESMVADFARCLKVGGLLFIANSNFRFCDTAVFRCFEVALSQLSPVPDPRTPVYDRANQLVRDAAYGDLVFRKLRDPDRV